MTGIRFRALIGSLALVALLTACGETRPTTEDWQSTWNSTVLLIPELASIEPAPSDSVCESVLVSLRTSEEDLFPTPSESLDPTVRTWFEVAEGAFFECPPGEPGGFASAYEEMETLEAEVDAVLDIDG